MRRKVAVIALLSSVGLLVGCSTGGTGEATFPVDPINIVGYTSPGSSIDLFQRQAATLLQDELGVRLVVENRPGGGGTDALNFLVNQPADGYWLSGWTSSLSSVLARRLVDATVDDLTYICQIVTEPTALWVRDDSQWQDFDEFLEYARENPDTIRVGSAPGVGNFNHLVLLELQDVADFSVTYVPYEGGGDLVAAVLGGEIDASLSLPSGAALDESRVLGVTGDTPFEYLPESPLFADLGYELEGGNLWRGFIAAKGLSPERAEIIESAIRDMVETPEWKVFAEEQNYTPNLRCGEDFKDVVAQEVDSIQTTLEKYDLF